MCLASLLVFIIVGTLLAFGLPARVIGDHPHCRRCGYDLFGNPAARRCSECGADLLAKRAARRGFRQPRRGFRAAGIISLPLSLTLLWLAGRELLPRYDWRPTWWLKRDAFGPDPIARDNAVSELVSRIQEDKLSQAQVRSIADDILAMQAGQTRQWRDEWIELMVVARLKSLIDDRRMRTFVQPGYSPTLRVRSQVRQGSPVPLQWNVAGSWTASQHSALQVAGGPTVLADRRVEQSAWRDCLERGTPTFRSSLTLDGPLPPGRYGVGGKLHITYSYCGAALLAWDAEVNDEIEIVGPDKSTVTLVTDAYLKQLVEASLGPVSFRSLREHRVAELRIRFDNPPVGLAFDVFVDNGRQPPWRFCAITQPAGGRMECSYERQGLQVVYFTPKVNLILKPSIEAAEETADITRIWGEPVTILNVPVASAAEWR